MQVVVDGFKSTLSMPDIMIIMEMQPMGQVVPFGNREVVGGLARLSTCLIADFALAMPNDCAA